MTPEGRRRVGQQPATSIIHRQRLSLDHSVGRQIGRGQQTAAFVHIEDKATSQLAFVELPLALKRQSFQKCRQFRVAIYIASPR